MELIQDAVLDTLKLVPFLYLVYLLISYVEGHRDNRIYQKLTQAKWGGPIMGALFGCIPQCGFSAIGANLYSKRMISMGTMIAIFVSTSDEAIPILLAYPQMIHKVGLILGLKVLFAILIGYGVEGVQYLLKRKRVVELSNGMVLTEEDLEVKETSCGCGHSHHHEHTKSSMWMEALRHTVKITLFILVVNLVLNAVIEGSGEEVLESILLTNSVFQPALAALIGMIPNCAASIILTEMFIAGNLSLGSLIAGLCTGAGIGLVVLFKANKNFMDNLKILGILYVMGTLCGILVQFIR